jgi:plasmid stabilization system protein ParE
VIRVVFSDEAKSDAVAAFTFYEERYEGLGEHFRDHLGAAFTRIQNNPEEAPVIYRNVRRKLVQRFPYAVLYRIYPSVIYVVAVMHAKQDPAKWVRRATRDELG